MSKKNEAKTTLKWRLSEKPTVENISRLHELGLIDKDEARQIILDAVEVDPVTLEDLQNEVKLLRKMVLELSEQRPQHTIQIIEKEVEKWPKQPWWAKDYITFCSTGTSTANWTLSDDNTTALPG